MTPEEFRRHGHDVIDWIANYLDHVEEFPVRSPLEPGEVRARLPATPPAGPESFAAIMADLDTVIVPGLTHWQSPNFFAYFPGNNSYPSILGELVAAGLGVNGMSWITSPACTELETHVLDWMVDLLDLPDRFSSRGDGGAVIQDSASSATLCAILAARERATGGASNHTGVAGDLIAYTTAHAHSSIEKGIRIAGIGRDNLRLVDVDDAFAMRPEALAAAIGTDRAAGRRPFLVLATTGTTSSMAIDPIAPIADVCRAEGLWLHVDSAMAGVAALVPEFGWLNDGLQGADSYCTNPHKWLGVNFDCDLFFVADRRALTSALSIQPEYLRTAAGDRGEVIDYRDWQVPLGRRFRALKLWFVLRSTGIEELRRMIRAHVSLTEELATWIRSDERFEIVAPPRLNLVVFAARDGDDHTRSILERANATGRALFTPTVLNGRQTIRVCVGGRLTERRHVRAAWDLLRGCA